MPLTYGALIKRALLAGLAAGLLLALYTLVVVEPTIDRAVALEESMADAHAPTGDGHSHADDEEAMFSRTTQVGGGMAATIIYAAVAAAVFGTVLASIRHRLPHLSELTRVVWLAAIAFGTVALMPALKYPANPPAVGDPDTVNERTVQYLVLVGLSVALAVGLVRLSGWLRPRLDDATRMLAVAGATVVAYGLLLVLMPPSPDAIDPAVPARLVWDFRIRSLGGLALLWTAIGLGLGWALDRLTATEPAATEPSVVGA
jgi:predicted cobalt transporter CbtA